MKKYTLVQMLQELEKNPDLKFEYQGEMDGKELEHTVPGEFVGLSKNHQLVDDMTRKNVQWGFTLNSYFTRPMKRVSVGEALHALEEGRVSSACCIRLVESVFVLRHGGGDASLTSIVTQLGRPVSLEELLYGDWYIREDDKID
jgi:hypothetical protein